MNLEKFDTKTPSHEDTKIEDKVLTLNYRSDPFFDP
jgi:hypothetical protein